MNEEYTSTTTLTEQTVENERDARTEELQKEKVVERQLAFQSEVPVKQDELRSNPTS